MIEYLYIPLLIILVGLWFIGANIYIWSFIMAVIVYLIAPNNTIFNIYIVIHILFLLQPIRRRIFSAPILRYITKFKLLPAISKTERIALRSGTVWVDGEIFSGKINFKKIMEQPYSYLTKEEVSFLEEEVEEVCFMTNDYETLKNRDLSNEVWDYLKTKGFFGMIIPKKYGGLGFSALGHSTVIKKLATHSQTLAITTMVPNSLGPAELILNYGTKKQKDYYLKRLATGEEIPCFALTEPLAGSDATSIRSKGVIFKDGNTLKISLDFNKRYITLGSVATLIGVAFYLYDPKRLLSDNENLGITCALINANAEGIIQNQRHDPLGGAFINSPLIGKEIIIELDDIIGGNKGIGRGWSMLNESLAVGRGISLPATSTGAVKLCASVAGAYATIREQFGLSIGRFEGVEEILGDIAAKSYLIEAARRFTVSAIDNGEKPSVITAIMKYHSTEIFRKTINNAMDIVGGAGISLGDKNLLGSAYIGAPIAITVEGANIITRTLLQFGQGVIACHPFIYKEIIAIENRDLKAFDNYFFKHIGLTCRNGIRMVLLSLTRGYLHKPISKGVAAYYERKLVWVSATFSFLADFLMIFYGSSLRQKEKITARFGDILSHSYLLIATIRAFKENGNLKDEEIFIKYNGDKALNDIQNAFDDIFANLFKNRYLKLLSKPLRLYARLNRLGSEIEDNHTKILANTILHKGNIRDKLTKDVYKGDRLTKLETALELHENASKFIPKIKKAITNKVLPKQPIDTLLDISLEKKVINSIEYDILKRAYKIKHDFLQVNSYIMQKQVNKL